MTAPVLPSGRPLPPMVAGSPEWLHTMSASKIAAVVGLSPYESRYSLWHRMAHLIPTQPSTPHLERGHYLEAGIAAWFADQHPDWTIRPARSWQHREHDRFTATPDRELVLPDGEIRGLELKTAADDNEWGADGTDQIPAGYLAQTQWQMLCAGYRVTHVAVLSAYLTLREYVVAADDSDADLLQREAHTFLASLPDGPNPQRPDVDSHDATYEAIRRLHPGIDDREAEVSAEVADRYPTAYRAHKAAERELVGAKAQLLDEMGDAKRAVHLDQPIARRQPGPGGSVSLYATFKDPS